jgi:hypothetical protein
MGVLGDARRMSGSRRKTVVTIDVTSALGLFGASTGLLVGGVHAATRGDAAEAHALYTLLRLLTRQRRYAACPRRLAQRRDARPHLDLADLRDRWLTATLPHYLATVTVGVTLVGPSIEQRGPLAELVKRAPGGQPSFLAARPRRPVPSRGSGSSEPAARGVMGR